MAEERSIDTLPFVASLNEVRETLVRDPEEYWRRVRKEGRELVERRFLQNGFVWGREPAPSAIIAELLARVLQQPSERARKRTALVPGCAYGRNALYFARRGWQVLAFDTSSRAIDMAREWMGWDAACSGDVDFLVADATSPTPEALGRHSPYDLVYLGKTLHQFRDSEAEALLRLLHGLLAPTGVLAISAMARSGEVFADVARNGVMVDTHTYDVRGFRPVRFYSEDQLEELLRHCGFTAVESTMVQEPETHSRSAHETSGDSHAHDMLFTIGRRVR